MQYIYAWKEKNRFFSFRSFVFRFILTAQARFFFHFSLVAHILFSFSLCTIEFFSSSWTRSSNKWMCKFLSDLRNIIILDYTLCICATKKGIRKQRTNAKFILKIIRIKRKKSSGDKNRNWCNEQKNINKRRAKQRATKKWCYCVT